MARRLSFVFDVPFAAASAIDEDKGTLIGVSVAEIGVATGHFVCLDKAGQIIGVDDDEIPGTVRKVPLCADMKTLESIVEAGRSAGKVKARENHDDSIGARAGYSTNFRLADGKAVCDLAILDAYRNRAVFFETAAKTPEMIGLSGHFKFIAEVIGDEAFMRVTDIEAVDLVDEGALTHAGLFDVKPSPPPRPPSKKGAPNPKMRVDSPTIPKAANKILKTPMADAPKIPAKNDAPPTPDIPSDIPETPDMDEFKAMCEQIGAYASALKGNNTDFASRLAECMAAITPVVVPTPDGAPAPVDGKPSNPDAPVDSPVAAFKAILTSLVGGLEAKMTRRIQDMEKTAARQFSALGLKPGQVPSAPAPGDDKPKDQPMNFLELKAKAQTDLKLKPGDAAEHVIKTNRQAWMDHLKGLGIYDPAKDPRRSVRTA